MLSDWRARTGSIFRAYILFSIPSLDKIFFSTVCPVKWDKKINKPENLNFQEKTSYIKILLVEKYNCWWKNCLQGVPFFLSIFLRKYHYCKSFSKFYLKKVVFNPQIFIRYWFSLNFDCNNFFPQIFISLKSLVLRYNFDFVYL